MRNLSISLVAVASILMFGATSAVASEFVATQTGTPLSVPYNKTMSLDTGDSAGVAETKCTQATGSGEVTALKSESLDVSVNFEACSTSDDWGSYFGENSPATFEFNADGQVRLVDEFTRSLADCNIALPPQTLSEGAAYFNEREGVGIRLSLKNVAYRYEGLLCGSEPTTRPGTWKAWVNVEPASGRLKWEES